VLLQTFKQIEAEKIGYKWQIKQPSKDPLGLLEKQTAIYWWRAGMAISLFFSLSLARSRSLSLSLALSLSLSLSLSLKPL